MNGLKLAINSEELVKSKGGSRSGTYVKIEDFKEGKIGPIEEWSRLILSEVFNVTVQTHHEQLSIPYSFEDKLI